MLLEKTGLEAFLWLERLEKSLGRTGDEKRREFEKYELDVFRLVHVESLNCVVPAWSAGIQIDTEIIACTLSFGSVISSGDRPKARENKP
jgi:hypothetical protein